MSQAREEGTDRGEDDVEQIEDAAEGGVLPGEHLALGHVDEEVEQDDDAEGMLPRGRVEQFLHAQLRGGIYYIIVIIAKTCFNEC